MEENYLPHSLQVNEKILLKGDNFWDFIKNGMPIAIYRCLATLERPIVFCNNLFRLLTGSESLLDLGFQKKNLITIESFIYEEDIETARFRLHEAIKFHRPYNNEFRIQKPDGQIVWVLDKGIIECDEDGRPLFVNGTWLDLSYIKSVNEGRVAEDEWLIDTLKKCCDGAWDWTTVTNYPKISHSFKKLLGYEPEDTAGDFFEWWLQNIHPEDFIKFSEHMTYFIDNPQDFFAHECRVKKKDDSYIWVLLRGYPQINGEGKVFRLAGIATDITAYRQLQAELKEAAAETEKISQAKSKFIASLNHELRTPLSGIIGMVNLLKETNINPQQTRYINDIKKSAELLLNLVNDILDVSKIAAGKLQLEQQPIDLKDLTNNVVHAVYPLAQNKRLRLNTDIDSFLPETVIGDPIRLQQILLNLLSNAVKFTQHGYVSLTMQLLKEGDPLQKINPPLNKPFVIHFEITDTGIGIPPKALDTLFDDFTQGSTNITRQYGGTGLGLSICKKLVNLMEGDIGVISAEGKGSDFWFQIPFAAGTQELDPLKTAPLRILLAEDNPINQEVMQGLIERIGDELVITQNGVEAVNLFNQQDFDLILMDINMPIMDGLEATKKIRLLPKGRDIPIIAVTANTMSTDQETCLALGMTDVVHKPVDKFKLISLLNPYRKNQSVIKQESSHQTSYNDLISQDTFKNLLEDLGKEKFYKLLKLYQKDSLELLDQIKKSSIDQIKSSVHTLAGMSENLGIQSVGSVSRQLIQLCQQTSPLIPEKITELEQTLQNTYQFIEEYTSL